MRYIIKLKGGEGSGDFGHSGRPGEVGGSAPSESVLISIGSKDPQGNEVIGYVNNATEDPLYKITNASNIMNHDEGTIIVRIRDHEVYYTDKYQEHFLMIDGLGKGENEDHYVRFRVMPKSNKSKVMAIYATTDVAGLGAASEDADAYSKAMGNIYASLDALTYRKLPPNVPVIINTFHKIFGGWDSGIINTTTKEHHRKIKLIIHKNDILHKFSNI